MFGDTPFFQTFRFCFVLFDSDPFAIIFCKSVQGAGMFCVGCTLKPQDGFCPVCFPFLFCVIFPQCRHGIRIACRGCFLPADGAHNTSEERTKHHTDPHDPQANPRAKEHHKNGLPNTSAKSLQLAHTANDCANDCANGKNIACPGGIRISKDRLTPGDCLVMTVIFVIIIVVNKTQITHCLRIAFFSSKGVPLDRFRVILFYAFSTPEAVAQIVHGIDIACLCFSLCCKIFHFSFESFNNITQLIGSIFFQPNDHCDHEEKRRNEPESVEIPERKTCLFEVPVGEGNGPLCTIAEEVGFCNFLMGIFFLLFRCFIRCQNLLEQFKCLCVVLFHAIPVTIAICQIFNCTNMPLFGSFCEPLEGFFVILFHTVTMCITFPQIVHGIGIAFFRGFLIPLDRFFVILFDTVAVIVAVPQIVHGPVIAFFRGFFVPLNCFFVILFNTFAVFVAPAQIAHGSVIAFFRGFLIPLNCFFVILFDAAAVFVAPAQIAHGIGIALFRFLQKQRECFLVPFFRFGFILFDAVAVFVADPQIAHGIGIAFFHGFLVPLDSFFVILFDAVAVFVAVPQIVHGTGIAFFRGFLIPLDRFVVILFDAVAVFVAPAQIEHGTGIAFFRLLHIAGEFRFFSRRVSAVEHCSLQEETVCCEEREESHGFEFHCNTFPFI